MEAYFFVVGIMCTAFFILVIKTVIIALENYVEECVNRDIISFKNNVYDRIRSLEFDHDHLNPSDVSGLCTEINILTSRIEELESKNKRKK